MLVTIIILQSSLYWFKNWGDSGASYENISYLKDIRPFIGGLGLLLKESLPFFNFLALIRFNFILKELIIPKNWVW